jgi:transcriptional regulator with XRE-family HTH domain
LVKQQVKLLGREDRVVADEPEHLDRLRQALGAELASLRKAARVTQQHLGHLSGFSRSSVSHAEAGRQLLGDAFWETADRLVNASGALLDRYGEVVAAIREHESARITALRESVTAPADLALHDVATTNVVAANDVATDDGANDDGVVSWDAAGLACLAVALDAEEPVFAGVLRGPRLTTVAHEWLLAEPVAVNHAADGGAIGVTLLDRLGALVHELRLVDDHLGGGQVLDLVEPEVRFAVRLMRRGSFTPDSRARLYRIIGELTQLAGWAAYDDGKHALAQRYYQTALYAAHVAGDRLLGVYVLSMLAFQASNLDQYHESLLLLDSARYGGKSVNTPGVLSMLDAWESRAHSLAGNREGFRRALGRASERFGRRRIEDDPDWLYWYRQPEHLAEMCRGFSLVGDHEQGITYLSDQTNVVDAEPSERDLILYHAYAGEAFLGLGELEAAAEHGHRALNLIEQDISSDRAFGYVKDLTGKLTSYRDSHEVRALTERLSTASGSSAQHS